jgi:aldehyde dehydrogenase (NAD+)
LLLDYPFQLALCPLVSAVAAGNQVVLKPSELTVTPLIISKIITKTFHTNHVEVVQGVDVSQNLLAQRWDYIFLQEVLLLEKIVASGSKTSYPVTLELGGKNPCIIDETAKLAAKKNCLGKFVNAGQTCIPDYILIQKT